MQEQELFNNYEVKTWDFSGRFYKILAVSAIFNLLALLVVGQSSLLTTKGCDSPLVGKVCTVIDALYVSGTVMTTNTKSVDEPYVATELTSDDEITFINFADQLTYPEGYFALSNPELAALQNDPNAAMDFIPGGVNPTIPGIPNNPTIGNPTVNNPLSKPQVLPKKPKGKVVDDLSDLDITAGLTDNPTVPKNPTERPRVTKSPDKKDDQKVADADAQKNLDPNNEDTIKTNKRPFKDLKPDVKDKLSKGMSLTAPFNVQAKGKLTSDGKIDKKTFKWTRTEGTDAALVEVVKSSVEAINDSGYLQYLTLLSGKSLDFQFSQDATSIAATVQSEMESETRAQSVSSLLSLAINDFKRKKEKAIAEMQTNPELAKELLDEIDDLELLKNAKVTADGKRIVIQFVVPQEVAGKMIERKLNEPDTPEKKPNSAAQVVNKATTTGK